MTAREILEDAGLASSHWGDRIIKADEHGGFDMLDRIDSTRWTTCACGKQDPRITRYEGEPVDPWLWDLGVIFANDVSQDDPIKAAETLIAIETRAAELLRDLK